MPARDLAWRVEETCWNAFPSLKQVLAGDFLLRFAGGVSRRANSANPLCAEPRDIPAAIAAAELRNTDRRVRRAMPFPP